MPGTHVLVSGADRRPLHLKLDSNLKLRERSLLVFQTAIYKRKGLICRSKVFLQTGKIGRRGLASPRQPALYG